MRKIEEVLRLRHELGLTHRAIGKSCSISPSTVGDYIKRAKVAGLSWPLPEGVGAEELNQRLFPEKRGKQPRRPPPDWAKVHCELRRKGVTLSLLWVEYRQAHPEGYGYSQYCVRYRRWRKKLKPMMRFKHRAGEKVFVDYAGHTVPIIDPTSGERHQAQIFVGVLGASNYAYAEAQVSQSLPNWIGGHVRMLAFFGGVPEAIVPDNLKAGVKSPHRYEPDLNPTYQVFAEHYGVAVIPARVRKPKDKSKVEVGVQVVERWILARLRDHQFFSITELNRAIRLFLDELNQRTMRHLGASRAELFATLDQPALAELPQRPYEYAEWKKARVHPDQHVTFDKRHYSVPYKLVGKQVDVRATAATIEIFHNHQRVASHQRLSLVGRYATCYEHLSPAHQAVSDWSPERFLKWAGEIGPDAQQLVAAVLASRKHPQQAYRSCMGILGLGKQFTNDRLNAACRRAVAAEIYSYRGIRNILDNHLDQVPLDPPITTPQPGHANIRGESYYH